ncbi:MAG: MotA/TolQ/ExbB proton channel family protein [Candidatus Brocadiia bacterium]
MSLIPKTAILIGSLSLVVILLLCGVLAAEDATVVSSDAGTGELRRAVLEAQDDLDRARVQCAREIDALESARHLIAGELVSSELATAEASAKCTAQKRKTDSLAADCRKLKGDISEMTGGLRQAAEQLSVNRRDIPGEGDSERLGDTLLEIAQNSDGYPRAALLLKEYLRRLDAALDSAACIRVAAVRIRIEDGSLDDVELLSVGSISFAYRIVRSGRVGIAFAAPDNALGYRWAEELPVGIRQQVSDTIDAVKAGRSDGVPVLVDLTSRLRSDSLSEGSSFIQTFISGGPVMYPLAIVALLALVIVFERAFFLFVRNTRNTGRIDKVLSLCRGGRFEEAASLLDGRRGVIEKTLAACIANRGKNSVMLGDCIQESLLHQLSDLRRFIPVLGILAAVSPLLGLLGTVTGIIRVFGVIGVFGTSNPNLMAGGIAEALITTAAGLIIAIPVFLLRGLFNGRADTLTADAEKYAATAYNMITGAGK